MDHFSLTGQPSPQDEAPHLPCPRSHQPLHVLALPHRGRPPGEGAGLRQDSGPRSREEEGFAEEAEEAEAADGPQRGSHVIVTEAPASVQIFDLRALLHLKAENKAITKVPCYCLR